MTLPANLTTGTVTGTLLDTATGAPLKGSVTFTPDTQLLLNRGGLTTHAAATKTVPLGKDGKFTVDLIGTDNADLLPVGWTWRVEFHANRPIADFSFPLASGVSVDISTLVPTPGSRGEFMFDAISDSAVATAINGPDTQSRAALDTAMANGIASNPQLQAAGDARWVVRSEAPRNLLSYPGVDPTGVTDSTDAVRAFLNDLSTYGGTGVARGVFRTSSTLSIAGGTGKPFTFDGGRATQFMARNAKAESFLNLHAGTGVILKGFSIDAGRAETGGMSNHGISADDCTSCIIEDVTITNWLNAAILFYRNPGGASVDNHIIRPRIDGANAAGNGVMLESTDRGSIIDARVYNLGRSGSPGYGIQLKNNSTRCRILGGWVENAVAGVAFGLDQALGPSYNLVSDVYAYNCKSGLHGGTASNNVITMRVDMAGNADSNQAIRFQADSSGNDVRAQVDNIASPKACIRVDTGNDNRIHLTQVNGVGRPKIYEVFGATSTRNQFRVGTVVGYTGTPFASSTDAGTGNVAVYEGP